MDWHRAFLEQARSDHAVLRRLSRLPVEDCHRLHYLQMVSEKLAKAMLTRPGGGSPPAASHAVLVRMLQVLKARPDLRRQLGFSDAASFKSYIDSLLDLAGKIEGLAPALAGFTQPNAEYPWQDPGASEVQVPARYDFPEFDPRTPRMIKIHQLIEDLLRIVG